MIEALKEFIPNAKAGKLAIVVKHVALAAVVLSPLYINNVKISTFVMTLVIALMCYIEIRSIRPVLNTHDRNFWLKIKRIFDDKDLRRNLHDLEAYSGFSTAVSDGLVELSFLSEETVDYFMDRKLNKLFNKMIEEHRIINSLIALWLLPGEIPGRCHFAQNTKDEMKVWMRERSGINEAYDAMTDINKHSKLMADHYVSMHKYVNIAESEFKEKAAK